MNARLTEALREIRAAGLLLESDGEGSRWRAQIWDPRDPCERTMHEGVGPTRTAAQRNAVKAWRDGVAEIVS